MTAIKGLYSFLWLLLCFSVFSRLALFCVRKWMEGTRIDRQRLYSFNGDGRPRISDWNGRSVKTSLRTSIGWDSYRFRRIERSITHRFRLLCSPFSEYSIWMCLFKLIFTFWVAEGQQTYGADVVIVDSVRGTVDQRRE